MRTPEHTLRAGKESISAHAAAVGTEILCKYGPRIGWKELQQILCDRTVVRYPCELAFDRSGLLPGEAAHAQQKADDPRDGFTVYVDPCFESRPEEIVGLALYQLVTVNYGSFASANDAESFGAAALGISSDEYYQSLCALVDRFLAASSPAQNLCPVNQKP